MIKGLNVWSEPIIDGFYNLFTSYDSESGCLLFALPFTIDDLPLTIHAEGVRFNRRGHRPRSRISRPSRPSNGRIRKDPPWPRPSLASRCM
jgi:hypothetical protein